MFLADYVLSGSAELQRLSTYGPAHCPGRKIKLLVSMCVHIEKNGEVWMKALAKMLLGHVAKL